MKILKCPKCGNIVVLAEYNCNVAVKCVKCKHTDYAYTFTRVHNLYQSKKNINSLAELLPIFKDKANSLKKHDPNVPVLIADLANQYQVAQSIIADIINIYIDTQNQTSDSINEKYFFSDYICEQVSIDALYQSWMTKMKEYQDIQISFETPANAEMEIRSLKFQLIQAKDKLESMRKQYDSVGRSLHQYVNENRELKECIKRLYKENES